MLYPSKLYGGELWHWEAVEGYGEWSEFASYGFVFTHVRSHETFPLDNIDCLFRTSKYDPHSHNTSTRREIMSQRMAGRADLISDVAPGRVDMSAAARACSNAMLAALSSTKPPTFANNAGIVRSSGVASEPSQGRGRMVIRSGLDRQHIHDSNEASDISGAESRIDDSGQAGLLSAAEH